MRRPPARQVQREPPSGAHRPVFRFHVYTCTQPQPVMRRSRLCGLAVLLAGLAAAAGMQPNCKKLIKNYVLEHCSGFRDKRSADEGPELEPARDLESDIKESRISKRQAMTLGEIIMTSGVPVYDYRYLHGPSFIGTVIVPVAPATDTEDYESESSVEALPQEKNSDLGFEMDRKELEELFEELSDRLPRSPNLSTNEIDMKSVFACCANNEMCKSMGSMIGCP